MKRTEGALAFAHSGPGGPGPTWHLLEEHLRSVATRARSAGEAWGGGDIAALAGLWHDLGKYAPDWQQFLRTVGQDASAMDADAERGIVKRRRGPDHSSAGAIHAFRTLGEKNRTGQVIAFVIAGHHAGLADWQSLKARLAKPELAARFDSVIRAPGDVVAMDERDVRFPEWFVSLVRSATPSERASIDRSFEFLVRMTFSALTDSDFLDTEAFVERAGAGGRTEARSGWNPLQRYHEVLTNYLEARACEHAAPVVT